MEKKTTDKSTRSSEPAVPSGAASPLGRHLAETAWRVAVPFLVFSLGGIKLDEYLDTLPWFTLIGLFLALASVMVIVRRYVAQNFPETFKHKAGDDND